MDKEATRLRLVVTRACLKNCEGCCMQPPPVEPKEMDLLEILKHPAEEIYITGGEPMLVKPIIFENFLKILSEHNKKIFIYSAECRDYNRWFYCMRYLSGITFTIHNAGDWDNFREFEYIYRDDFTSGNLSLRLNVFDTGTKSILQLIEAFPNWVVTKKEWIEDCPLPEGEDFGEHILY